MSLPVFQTFPLTNAAGAEIQGLDLSFPLSDDTTKRLRRIWLRHGVLFFRKPKLDPGQLLKVAKAFGETMPYPLLKGLEGFPEVTVVSKMEQEEMNFGGIWHSDTAYLETSDGEFTLCVGGSGTWRGHPVRKPGFGLRIALGGHEGSAVRTDSHQHCRETRRHEHPQ